MKISDIMGQALDDFSCIRAATKLLTEKIAGGHDRIYVIGKNPESLAVIKAYPVAGVIDDFAGQPSTWNGIRSVKGSDVPPGAIIVNCSTSISPLSVARRMGALEQTQVLSYADLCRPGSLGLPLPSFVEEARRDIEVNLDKCSFILDRLQDKKSKEIFVKLISYRLTADPTYMEGFSVSLKDQYFSSFVGSQDGAIFVDCGGFDGDTTEEFICRYPNYGKVYLFEPETSNLIKAKQRLKDIRDIEFIPFGVSDSSGTLFFNSEEGSASSISSSGTATIDVVTLDDAIKERISFIKMDLEGWELPALKGGRNHISEDHPILALAVYHRMKDFWTLPDYVLSLRQDYSIHLRHYTEGWSESVMYFIPA